ncbi:crossover junction endodeoxyribonuclease RuvC [Candidatus Uhrbacteria bacterium CG_4_9_14_3_um_filter_50_9]|uniref:Crossover junction endodeoxyribonuclease RuvC n=1 Tax=Candidatus Uhrbacteria bacterium CG_4_9_14_3_um_filter_50_9 TaxID=1975035 RepID=A0A2M7XCF7_9BACT|nr:MAG: crossover junction endodeoxyribonuclease RuvC [Candidatus Uhrbacteria bacterium CG_4_9_14_3_um_filter_50_9]
MEERIILGLDPGYGRMGFGVIHVEGHTLHLLDYGVATTPTGMPFGERLHSLATDLDEILEHHEPDLVAIEKLYFGKSSSTAMKVAEARGVAQLMVAQSDIPICEFTPAQIKKALTGNGRAGKTAMQTMVKTLLGLEQVPKPDDAADAIAAAITASTMKL